MDIDRADEGGGLGRHPAKNHHTTVKPKPKDRPTAPMQLKVTSRRRSGDLGQPIIATTGDDTFGLDRKTDVGRGHQTDLRTGRPHRCVHLAGDDVARSSGSARKTGDRAE